MNQGDTTSFILRLLQSSPGLTARAIARELRPTFGPDFSRSAVNSVLYRERALFRSEGYSPPQWFANQASKPSRDKPQGQTNTTASLTQPIEAPSARQEIRPYSWQEAAISAWKGKDRRGILEAVTGTGKTHVAIMAIKEHLALGQCCLVLVPSVVLLEQWKRALQGHLGFQITSLLGGPYGRSFDRRCPVTIGVVDTVVNIADVLTGQFDLVVADECHRYAAPKFRRALFPTSRYRMGLTATLERNDAGVEDVLEPYFGGVCFRYGFSEARRDDVIARYGLIAIGVDLPEKEMDQYLEAGRRLSDFRRKLEKQFGYPNSPFAAFIARVTAASARYDLEGRLAKGYLAALQERRKLVGESESKLEIIPQLADAINSAASTLVYCATIDAAEEVVDILRGVGISAESFHSKKGSREREEIIEKLSAGEIKCVVAVNALDEGVDVPNIDLAVVLSGARQRRQMIQRMGRVLRRKHDRRGAAFIVVYANGTAEDPAHYSEEDGYLSVLKENAEEFQQFGGGALSEVEIENLSRNGISRAWGHRHTHPNGAATDRRSKTEGTDASQLVSLIDAIMAAELSNEEKMALVRAALERRY